MAVYPTQNGVFAQNGEQPIRLPNSLLYPRVEVEQRTQSRDEIGRIWAYYFENPSEIQGLVSVRFMFLIYGTLLYLSMSLTIVV